MNTYSIIRIWDEESHGCPVIAVKAMNRETRQVEIVVVPRLYVKKEEA